MKNKVKAVVLHCDGYYDDGVCLARGKTDYNDARNRCLCLSKGMIPHSKAICLRCCELKKVFHAPRQRKAGKIKILTPYKAVNKYEETVRASDDLREIANFVLANPELTLRINQ